MAYSCGRCSRLCLCRLVHPFYDNHPHSHDTCLTTSYSTPHHSPTTHHAPPTPPTTICHFASHYPPSHYTPPLYTPLTAHPAIHHSSHHTSPHRTTIRPCSEWLITSYTIHHTLSLCSSLVPQHAIYYRIHYAPHYTSLFISLCCRHHFVSSLHSLHFLSFS